MSKTIKLVLLGVVIVVVVVLGKPFLQGFSSSFAPGEAIKMAKRKTAENVNVYVPTGYTLVTKAEARESDVGTVFVTDMEKESYLLRIMQGDKDATECKGTASTLGTTSVCLFDFGSIPSSPTSKVVRFDKGSSTFQMEINDPSLLDDEVVRIIDSLR